MAVEQGVIGGSGANGCGKGVEGYASPAASEAVARRIKSLGGQLDCVAMDEPVWFGHIVGHLSADAAAASTRSRSLTTEWTRRSSCFAATSQTS